MTYDWRTRVLHAQSMAPAGFRSLVTPVYRGSTTLFESAGNTLDTWDKKVAAYAYGLYGTPTTFELAARIAELEGGKDTFIVPGGQAALALIYLAFARAGDHVLVPKSVYGPSMELAARVLQGLGIETEFYDPLVGAGIEGLIRKNTRLVWCESPGSVTMEIQDVPAIAAAAHKHNAVLALDNTYSAGVLFDAFAHGVDVTMQALTKYIGGHSDLLLGSVTVREDPHYQRLGDAHQLLGMAVSPDDCSLALRGLQTLAVRLAQLEKSTLELAGFLSERPEIDTVLHPALPSCPGHEIWKRDFTGSSSVFSAVFASQYSRDQIVAFVDALELFEIGYSWGGVTSLVMPFFDLSQRSRTFEGKLVRFNIGLESPRDLIADLTRALGTLGA
jgi:cystathionine beta-lyase